MKILEMIKKKHEQIKCQHDLHDVCMFNQYHERSRYNQSIWVVKCSKCGKIVRKSIKQNY